MDNIPINAAQIEFFLLVFVRVVTALALLPIFGSQSIPYQLKVALALLLTISLFATLPKPVLNQELSFGLLVMLVMKEIFVGLAIGFIASMLFVAVQFAGRLVDVEMGFGFVELVDPFTDEPVTTWGQLQVLIFTILFLLFNGHYFLLLALQRSFEIVPLMSAHLPGGPLSEHVTSMISNLFVVSIKLAAPIYVTLILTEISMGVVARTVPQINIFIVGLPLKIMVGMGTAVLVFPMIANLFRRMVEGLIQDIWRLLYLMA